MNAATRRGAPQEVEDYAGEPNIRLSSAVMVVLVLHVVAIGGIWSFNKLKTRQIPSVPAAASKAAPEQPPIESQKAPTALPAPAAATLEPANGTPLQAPSPAAAAASRIASTSAPATKPAAIKPAVAKSAGPSQTQAARDSGKTYAVAKGENPVLIAKKLGVSYEALLQLNKIDDPRKLQIGQRLRIPVKSKP